MNFSHLNSEGRPKMTNVSDKKITHRTAIAEGQIIIRHEVIALINEQKIKKGDPLTIAQIAGICGAKKTPDIIPLCHNIFITSCDIEFEIKEDRIIVRSIVTSEAKTGVEMEALTAVTTACLAIYDMCKSTGKDMMITGIRLVNKTGGKSGDYSTNSKEIVEEEVKNSIIETNGKKSIKCSSALIIAQKYGINSLEVTKYCNKNNIKICCCQLGCFK